MTSVTERVTDVSQTILLEMHRAWILLKKQIQHTLILSDVLLAWSRCWRRLRRQNGVRRLPLRCRRGVSRLSIDAGARMCCPIGEQHLIRNKRAMSKSSNENSQTIVDVYKMLSIVWYLHFISLECFFDVQQPTTAAESDDDDEASADKGAAPSRCQSAFNRGGRCAVKGTGCSRWDPESGCGTQDDVCQFTQPWRQRESLAQWFWFIDSDFWFTLSNRRAW